MSPLPRHARFGLMTLALLPLFCLAACTAQYPLNPKAERVDREEPLRLKLRSVERAGDLLVILAFSGGGTRAAALSYGVLEALDLVEIPPPPAKSAPRHTLLDEVDIISGVSGGSFTAAYYGLHGRDIFNSYRTEFLTEDFQGGLMWGFANPFNLVRCASPRFGRSDMAQEYYDDHLFRKATLGDLAKAPGPVVLILATDAATGIPFAFRPSQFALICSDFDSFPVARAVAASAAFPGAFSPVVLKNYAGQCDIRVPTWIRQALEKPDLTSRTYYNALRLKTYLDPATKPYVHLIDGGVSDNLGVRAIVESLIARGGIRESLRQMHLERTRRVAVIIVDAQTRETPRPQMLDEVPGLAAVLGISSTIMINKYNFETLDLLHRVAQEWAADDAAQDRKPLDFYIVHVAFDALPDEAERDYFNDIPTSLSLPEEQVDRLRGAAGKILYADRDFRRLVRDLGGRMPDGPEPGKAQGGGRAEAGH